MIPLLVFDNEGKTFDRYTIIRTDTGDCVGASEDPFHPQGFGQHCGNVADNYWREAYGTVWRKGCTQRLIKRRIKFAVDHYAMNCSDKKIGVVELPERVFEWLVQLEWIIDVSAQQKKFAEIVEGSYEQYTFEYPKDEYVVFVVCKESGKKVKLSLHACDDRNGTLIHSRLVFQNVQDAIKVLIKNK